MKLLLDDEFAPLTSAIGFIEADCATVVDAFLLSQEEKKNRSFVKKYVTGSLSTVLPSLLPLTELDSVRYLFVPTASSWTACFVNGLYKPDLDWVIGYVAPRRVGCRGLSMTAVPHTLRRTLFSGRPGRNGAVMFRLCGPDAEPPGSVIRVIYVVHDLSRWRFDQGGEPLPFEETRRYRAWRKRNRFTMEMLRDYGQALGVRAFDEDFYLPPEDNTAVLLEQTDLRSSDLKSYTLAEARAHY